MKAGSSRNSEYDFFSQNLYSNHGKDITAEFLSNSKRVKSRSNGNYLFHEVISITKSKQLNLAQEKERLYDIVCHYANARCHNNLAVGFLHDEKSNNVHYHLMISSNEIGEFKNQRLTKYDFNKIKIDTEKYVIDKYPELEQDIIINAKKDKHKEQLSKNGWELKRKGSRLEKKEKITEQLKNIFDNCQSKPDYFDRLSSQNVEMYNRGNTIGFINLSDNKKYRLKTLGLETDFNKIQTLLSPAEPKTEKQKPKGNESNKTKADSKKSKHKEKIRQARYQNKANNKDNSKGTGK